MIVLHNKLSLTSRQGVLCAVAFSKKKRCGQFSLGNWGLTIKHVGM